jgi:hypothetical protein
MVVKSAIYSTEILKAISSSIGVGDQLGQLHFEQLSNPHQRSEIRLDRSSRPMPIASRFASCKVLAGFKARVGPPTANLGDDLNDVANKLIAWTRDEPNQPFIAR